jgi:hypothetical protein
MYFHLYATSLCSGYVFHSSKWGIREVGGTNASVMFGTSITNVLILTIKCERVCVQDMDAPSKQIVDKQIVPSRQASPAAPASRASPQAPASRLSHTAAPFVTGCAVHVLAKPELPVASRVSRWPSWARRINPPESSTTDSDYEPPSPSWSSDGEEPPQPTWEEVFSKD